MTFTIDGVDVVHDGWARYLVASVRLPDGRIVRREIEDHGSAVSVLPFDPERRTAILVRQFRAPVFFAEKVEDSLEAIAGVIEEPDPVACARREALEEAGLRLGAIDCVTRAWTMPGISTERAVLFLAVYRAEDRVGTGGGLDEEHEQITVVELPLQDLAEMTDAGAITDLKTLMLIQTLRLRRPDLFERR